MKPVTCPPAVTGDSGEQLLSVREVVDALGLGPRVVRDYVARGELSGRLIRGWWLAALDLDRVEAPDVD